LFFTSAPGEAAAGGRGLPGDHQKLIIELDGDPGTERYNREQVS